MSGIFGFSLNRGDPELWNVALYTTGDREKYGVDVTRYFYDGRAPLSLVVRLLPHEEVCSIRPVEGMTKVDQLMRNAYRRELIEQRRLQQHFQRCVTLAMKIPMVAVTRIDGEDCAGIMYELITDHMVGLYQNGVKG